MKMTRHNGRAGKNGVYNPKHNDRQFDLTNADHIDAARERQNIYWDCFQGFRTGMDDGQAHDSFENVERQFYSLFYHESKETIVLFNEGEDTAHIQTYNAGLRNRLAAFSKKYPNLCRLDKTYEQGGVSYVLDKSRLSIRLQPPHSEERRRKASENAKQNGFAIQTE